MNRLRVFWARLVLAWRVFRHPDRAATAAQIAAASSVRGPVHEVIWTEGGVTLVLTPFGNTDHRFAARIFRDIKYRKKRGLTVYLIDGLERDRFQA